MLNNLFLKKKIKIIFKFFFFFDFFFTKKIKLILFNINTIIINFFEHKLISHYIRFNYRNIFFKNTHIFSKAMFFKKNNTILFLLVYFFV